MKKVKKHSETAPVGRPPKHPWQTLEIGETFKIKGRSIVTVWPQCWMAGKRWKRHFKCVETKSGDVVVRRVA